MLYDFLKSKGVFDSIKTGNVIDIESGDGREGKFLKKVDSTLLRLI